MPRNQSLRGFPKSPTLTALCAAALALGTHVASAGLYLRPGDHVLQPDQSGQTVQILLENDGPSSVDVDTFEFFAIIGDGGPAAGSGVAVPSITGYDLHTGTPFASNFQPEVTTSGGDGVIQAYISTASGSVSIAPGIMPIATLTIDTTGFQVGDDPWTLALQSFTMEISSQLVRLGDPVAAELLSGEISLAAVPEPAPMAVAAGLGLLGFALWRRHRSA